MTQINDIDEIVRQTVADAIRSGELLQVNCEARRIAAETGLPRHNIAQELFAAGIAARINMEFGERPGTAQREQSTPDGVDAEIRPGGFDGIELQHNLLRLPVKLGGGPDGEAITGFEEDDTSHQPRGESEGMFACE